MVKKTKYVVLLLISILATALLLSPTQIAYSDSTLEQIKDVTIEWIINETDSKKAIVHVITSKGHYSFLVKGNAEQVGEEHNVNLDAYLLLENGTQVYTQSANVSVFDILYDAPYAPPSAGVETIKIHLGSLEAGLLALASIIAIVFMFVEIIGVILEATVLTALLDSLQWTILVASIPWVYLSIFSADRNPDGSLTLYVPWDEYILPTLLEGILYVATAFSWWLIAKAQWWIFSWYTATWVQPRLEAPPSPKLPSASFAWSPDTVVPGQEVTFVSTSFDPDGEIASWHWWFGDGLESYGESVTHAYSKPGSYNVRLEATDNDGLKSETSTSIMGMTFFVIPETSLGTISVTSTMIGALALFIVVRHRKKVNLKVSKV